MRSVRTHKLQSGGRYKLLWKKIGGSKSVESTFVCVCEGKLFLVASYIRE